MEKGYFLIKLPANIIKELNDGIIGQPFDDIHSILMLDEDEKKIDPNNLKLALGGEEINLIKLLFECAVSAGVSLFADYLIDKLKEISKKKKELDKNFTIEFYYPDGRVIKIKESNKE